LHWYRSCCISAVAASLEAGVGETGERYEEAGARSVLIDDAARLLGVSRRTVYYRIREGRLLTIRARCGSQRVLLSSIESLLQEWCRARKPRAPAAADKELESEALSL